MELIDKGDLKEMLCLKDLIQMNASVDSRIVDKMIDSAPTIEAEPVKHGRWIEDETTYAGTGAANWLCSECKRIGGTWWRDISPSKMYRYCPNCGARMDGEE